MTTKNGFQAMITQHGWMFLSSFEKLREKMMLTETVNMAHLGARAFEEIGGEVVQTTTFVRCMSHITGYKGTYCRLVEPTSQNGKKKMFLAGENRFCICQDEFVKIPRKRIGYWVSDALLKQFQLPPLSNYADTRRGLQTGNAGRFVRNWYETDVHKVELSLTGDARVSTKKWILFNSGGSFRRWYGNILNTVNWENNGLEIKSTGKAIIPSEERYFDEVVSWNKISSGQMSVRYQPCGIIPGDASPFLHSVRHDHDILIFSMAVLNSKVAAEIVKVLSPTLNFEVGNIAEIPLTIDKNIRASAVEISENNVGLSKSEWDAFEISWDFTTHPLVSMSKGLWDATATAAAMNYYYGSLPEASCPLEICYLLVLM